MLFSANARYACTSPINSGSDWGLRPAAIIQAAREDDATCRPLLLVGYEHPMDASTWMTWTECDVQSVTASVV